MSAADRQRDPLAGSGLEAVIGLEVHVQLTTRSKMFCGCEVRFGAEPNSLTCPVCLGLPGSLPVANEEAMRFAVRVGHALGCRIAEWTKFDRKNYFYPDLPKGYQISQYDRPLCEGGRVEYLVGDTSRVARLVRIHLEEDAGKNVHVEGRAGSRVDLNRAGTPLLEIVTEPDLRGAEEAATFLRMLRRIMLHLEVSDCNMEEGSLRCDCNVSVRPQGSEGLETRTEIKNLNSFQFIESALLHELGRQRRLREQGQQVVQETRLYDPARGETRSMRGKEEAHDYRYFPEPDLPPLRLEPAWVEAVCAGMPELPAARQRRLCEETGLSAYQAELVVRDREVADFFDRAAAVHGEPRPVANWTINALLEELNQRHTSLSELGISPERFADLVHAVEDGTVSAQKARDVLRAMIEDDRPVGEIIRALGLEQISDDAFIQEVVDRVVAENPGPVEDLRGGKKKSLNFLVGQVMRQTRGQANPGKAAELIRRTVDAG